MNLTAIAASCRIPIVLPERNCLLLFMRVTLFTILSMAFSLQMLVASSVQGQSIQTTVIQLELKNESLTSALQRIEKQTTFRFLYRKDDVGIIKGLTMPRTTGSVEVVLNKLLKGTSLGFRQVNKHIVISSGRISAQEEANNSVVQALSDPFAINGRIVDEKDEPFPGATVWVKGTRTGAVANSKGYFTVTVPDSSALLEFRFIGYVTLEVSVKSGAYRLVKMQPEKKMLGEVTISTGMFDRKAGSFTGAVSTFSGADLKVITNQNVLQGLAILDPSFQIIENNDLGSDPNRLPVIQLRGQTGFSNLSTDYSNVPNQPLFILDGFETTLQKVYDLNINMVKSITILKDASAKAIYGAKAGNGVVVIETVTPQAGALRISYNVSTNITAPDLSSYRLTNSTEKVEAEYLAGKYASAIPDVQSTLIRSYATNLKAALDGVDTYWLSKPLQNGVGQRHSVFLEGGDDAMRYSANLNYNNLKGVMKGSDRETLSGTVNLQYRLRKFSFRNNLMIDRNRAENSPYGSFSEYTRMNPYWRIFDETGALIPTYTSFSNQIYNPLYNASLNSINGDRYTMITENFYTDYNPVKDLRLTARVGITSQNNEASLFYPATHTRFMGISPTSAEYLNRGEFTRTNGKLNTYSTDLLAAYNLQFGKNQLLLNAGFSANESKTESTAFTMVGFPNDNIVDIAYGNSYKPNTKANGVENTSRSVGITSALNYAYDNRYLADLTYRTNASSQFGTNQRWGDFWSAGLGWNLQNESFIKNLKFINLLKVRGSAGSTGTLGFSSYQSMATYQYITNQNYNGDMGFTLMGLANPDLRWQKVMDYNIGTDATFFNRLSLRFDYFIKDTKGLLTDQIIAPSAGFSNYKENIGEVRNKGYQVSANMRVFAGKYSSFNVFVNGQHATNRIRNVSNSILALNNSNDNLTQRPGETLEQNRARRQRVYSRYVPGQSMNAIWAVPSLGIDPTNGKEIFTKKDGSLTYVWSADDYVVAGDNNPDFIGTFGTNFRFGNFTGNLTMGYRLGGQTYNSTLVQKVENADFNYNVDIRALEERWKTPGQVSLYKDIADISSTQPTTRFVQDLDELIVSAIGFGYTFNNPLSKLKISKSDRRSNLTASMNLNDLARFSTVKTERGVDYPFARTISFSLQASF
ncbi:SusC/RagA family TonB-linked outer membrane protein [Desertivirga brevis]|uniref:SusC/RagA family TonB-linked outer membrane protein n=1 Tax=Desertivirga brevis TaxID=2810310 RepID=UPI001A95AE8F|nr:SusC/RagA family TonB-linked outer membrane protein [Pedobacter sp. SYSU D00873]